MATSRALDKVLGYRIEESFGEVASSPTVFSASLVIDPNPASLKRAVLENNNERATPSVSHTRVRALQSDSTFPFSMHLTRLPVTAAEGAYPNLSDASCYLAQFMRATFGGLSASMAPAAQSSSTNVLTVTNSVPYGAGDFIRGGNDGSGYHFYRVISGSSPTTLTLDRNSEVSAALWDQSNSVACVWHATSSYSDASSASNVTLGLHFQGAATGITMRGCKPNVEFQTIEPGVPATMGVTMMVTQFTQHSGTVASLAQLSRPSGLSPVVIGKGTRRTQILVAEFGSSMASIGSVVYGVTPVTALVNEKIPSITGVEGVGGFAANPGVELGIDVSLPYDAVTWKAAFENGTVFHLLANYGGEFGCYYPALELAEDPSREENNNLESMVLKFRAVTIPTLLTWTQNATAERNERNQSPEQWLFPALNA